MISATLARVRRAFQLEGLGVRAGGLCGVLFGDGGPVLLLGLGDLGRQALQLGVLFGGALLLAGEGGGSLAQLAEG